MFNVKNFINSIVQKCKCVLNKVDSVMEKWNGIIGKVEDYISYSSTVVKFFIFLLTFTIGPFYYFSNGLSNVLSLLIEHWPALVNLVSISLLTFMTFTSENKIKFKQFIWQWVYVIYMTIVMTLANYHNLNNFMIKLFGNDLSERMEIFILVGYLVVQTILIYALFKGVGNLCHKNKQVSLNEDMLKEDEKLKEFAKTLINGFSVKNQSAIQTLTKSFLARWENATQQEKLNFLEDIKNESKKNGNPQNTIAVLVAIPEESLKDPKVSAVVREIYIEQREHLDANTRKALDPKYQIQQKEVEAKEKAENRFTL